MTRLLLIRHGTTDAVGQRLVGRLPGIPLNAKGRAEVAALGARLAGAALAAVYSSPLERALETASAIAAPHGLEPVLRETLTLALAGAAIGVAASLIATRLIDALLFGVQRGDGVTFAAMLGALTLVAAIAGYLPARRASRIDPMSALRAE